MDLIINTVKSKCEEIGIDIDTLSDRQMNYIIKIEKVLSQKIKEQESLNEQIKKCKISLNLISKETGISRQTFYNNEQLKNYVSYREEELNLNSTFNIIEKLQEQITELKEDNMKMKYRDIEIELFISEYESMKKKLEDKNKECVMYIKRNKQLEKQLDKVSRAKNSEDNGNAAIININKLLNR